MISSEVQRTLVKSPPELWTELSDPASLARHLGALGEIRITRAEPEKQVDWEADGASGSILIKPSGWGTKVTLSVTRELSMPEADSDDEVPDAGEEAPDVGEAPAVAEPSAAGETLEPAAAPEALAALEELEALEVPEALDESLDDAAPTAEIEALETPEDIEAVETPEAIDEAGAVSPDPDAYGADELQAPATEPRRGFLARLFGLRRRPRVAGAPAGARAFELAPESDGAAEPMPEPFEPRGAATAIESLQARFQPETDEPQDAPVPVEIAEDESGPQPSAEDDAGAVAVEEPSEPVKAPDADAAESPVADGGQVASEPAVDLAAELAAAEEVAVEEVTAVLTAVLDRLGAAHHRPFSRA